MSSVASVIDGALSFRHCPQSAIELLLRICVAMTFFGHGYLATKTQPSWFAYLRVVGIGSKLGAPLMRLIGVADMALAVIVLFVYPSPIAHMYCAIWGFATALMRPLAGESIHQFIERSGNWIPALALVFLETKDPKSDIDFSDACIAMVVVFALGVALSLWMRRFQLFAADCPTGSCDPVGEFLEKIEKFVDKSTVQAAKAVRKSSRAEQ